MDKPSKKELKEEIVDTLDQLLLKYHSSAAIEIKKSIKMAGKLLSKKFNKEIKKFEKENSKTTKKKVAEKKSKPVPKKRIVSNNKKISPKKGIPLKMNA